LAVDFRDLITPFKFGDDRLRGLGLAEGQISAFPIDFDGRRYNTFTLPCERVMRCSTHRQQSYAVDAIGLILVAISEICLAVVLNFMATTLRTHKNYTYVAFGATYKIMYYFFSAAPLMKCI